MACYVPPSALNNTHQLSAFDCGTASLNDWLTRRAMRNENAGASRTYVVCEQKKVIGYYALATGAVRLLEAPKKLQRNMPDPIPVMVLGRLAVDTGHQGKGVGQGLLKDAMLRVLSAGKIAGLRALLVHAISEEAQIFYTKNGFLSCPLDPMMLMLPLSPLKI